MIVETDRYFYEGSQYVWSPTRCAQAHEWAFQVFESELTLAHFREGAPATLLVGLPGAGKSTYARSIDSPELLIFDAVFSAAAMRSRAIALCVQYRVPVEAVFLDVPWEICVLRNELRSPDRAVPLADLEQFRRQLSSQPPTLSEGFQRVTVLRPNPSRDAQATE